MDDCKFFAYAVGIFYTSVCTSLSDEETTQALNTVYPTGVSSDWQISNDETFADGCPNPKPCEDKPSTHRHILFTC